MIPIHRPDNDNWAVKEHCCFCYTPTLMWTVDRKADVACCLECAETHDPSELPTKAQWSDEVVKMAV